MSKARILENAIKSYEAQYAEVTNSFRYKIKDYAPIVKDILSKCVNKTMITDNLFLIDELSSSIHTKQGSLESLNDQDFLSHALLLSDWIVDSLESPDKISSMKESLYFFEKEFKEMLKRNPKLIFEHFGDNIIIELGVSRYYNFRKFVFNTSSLKLEIHERRNINLHSTLDSLGESDSLIIVEFYRLLSALPKVFEERTITNCIDLLRRVNKLDASLNYLGIIPTLHHYQPVHKPVKASWWNKFSKGVIGVAATVIFCFFSITVIVPKITSYTINKSCNKEMVLLEEEDIRYV